LLSVGAVEGKVLALAEQEAERLLAVAAEAAAGLEKAVVLLQVQAEPQLRL
jgi:hypothetical protein